LSFRNILYLAAVLVIAIIVGGCSTPKNTQEEMMRVTADQVYAFQNQKVQKKLDIFIPLKEQYAGSDHAKSLQTLRESSNNIKPECYQCMSTEYYLAPSDQKPNPDSIKLSITCAVCHVMTPEEFTLKTNPLETCTSCHQNPNQITPGSVVHHAQKEMFLGYGAIGVPETPDSKYQAGLTCIECHMPNEAHSFEGLTPAKAIKENRESICVMCHADQSEEQFARKVDDMQTTIRNTCDQLAKDLEVQDKKIKENRLLGINMDEAQMVYNIVYTNLSFIQSDMSWGIHNFDYTNEILTYSKERQQELDGMLN